MRLSQEEFTAIQERAGGIGNERSDDRCLEHCLRALSDCPEHFPVTMRELNESVVNRISDHALMTAELPLIGTRP